MQRNSLAFVKRFKAFSHLWYHVRSKDADGFGSITSNFLALLVPSTSFPDDSPVSSLVFGFGLEALSSRF